MIKDEQKQSCHPGLPEAGQYGSHQELSAMAKVEPEAGQYGSHQELSAMAKVEPEARQYAPSPLEGEGWGEGFKKRAAFTLAEVPEARQHGSKQAAFALAEVLITLGIIGVVAAMTIPTLVKNYEKKITVTRLEKTYSTLSQAIKMAQAEHGDVSTWDFSLSGKEFFDTYFASLKKDAEYRFDPSIPQYRRLNGGYATNYYVVAHSDKVNVIELPSGAWILYYYDNTAHSDQRVVFHIDINGSQKPNQFGKDFFYLNLMRNGELVFYQKTDEEPFSVRKNRNELLNTNNHYACNKRYAGLWCGAVIQQDGWQIKDDYPW